MHVYGLLNKTAPKTVPAWLWLTGWLREDLGVHPRNGVLFDRIQGASPFKVTRLANG